MNTSNMTHFAPHTRGWSLRTIWQRPQVDLCPAHVGMVPPWRGRDSYARFLPRTRGDGPDGYSAEGFQQTFAPHTRGWSLMVSGVDHSLELCPAHAGMVPLTVASGNAISTLPRTRGDGPKVETRKEGKVGFAPHTRGWSGTSGAVFCFILGGMQ